jgi:hypothetical protein
LICVKSESGGAWGKGLEKTGYAQSCVGVGGFPAEVMGSVGFPFLYLT